MNLKKELSGVAKVAAQIMGEQLKGQQHQIDKNKNNKIDAHDFAILRGEKKAVKKEEVEQIDELSKDTLKSYVGKVVDKTRTMPQGAKKQKHLTGLGKAMDKMKEEVEQIQEYESKSGVYKHQGTYGTEKGAEYGETDWDKEEKESKKMAKPKKYGARQNYIRSPRVNEKAGQKIKESFTGILSQYQEGGLKNLFESFKKEEQVLNEEVKEETIEVEVTDLNATNGVAIETIEERTLTEPETAKKEEIVKSMKKKMSGFKQRYGEDAKSVMYATATKMAKKGA